jgi:hypothetical protein
MASSTFIPLCGGVWRSSSVEDSTMEGRLGKCREEEFCEETEWKAEIVTAASKLLRLRLVGLSTKLF